MNSIFFLQIMFLKYGHNHMPLVSCIFLIIPKYILMYRFMFKENPYDVAKWWVNIKYFISDFFIIIEIIIHARVYCACLPAGGTTSSHTSFHSRTVGWGCIVHHLDICRRVKHPNKYSYITQIIVKHYLFYQFDLI